MVLLKILKRKDASSVVVAVALAMILVQMLPSITGRLAVNLSGIPEGETFTGVYPDAGWKVVYLFPVVWAAIQVLALEVLSWVYVWARQTLKSK